MLVNIGKYWLVSVRILFEAHQINGYLDRAILTNQRLIATNYWLRTTKTEYAVVRDSIDYYRLSINELD